jgi:ketosteroid isomerase-like protein
MTDEPILAREAELRLAMLFGDVVALARLIDDALVFTGPDGAVVGKADDLEMHRSGRVRMTTVELGERQIVHLAPSIVLVVVRVELAGTFDGVAFQGPYRYTRIWAERPDGWRIVGGHVSAIAV